MCSWNIFDAEPLLWLQLLYTVGMSQIHLHTTPDRVSPYVLLPGDPGRARWIAETFLTDVDLYTEHRGLLGFTGMYRGLRVSVQTTGMGCPSTAIVVEELIRLGGRYLIRVGTCGAAAPGLRSADLVIAQGAVPADGTTRQYLGGAVYAPLASYDLLEHQVGSARALKLDPHVGLIMTEDAFYASNPEHARLWASRGVLAFEMEASALFLIAAMRGVSAGCALTVSNNIGDPELIDADKLQAGVRNMIEATLESFISHQGAQ